MSRSLLAGAALALLALVATRPVAAAGAPAGTAIDNTAQVNYTLGTTQLDPDVTIDVVLGEPRAWEPGPTISNSFGFGGHNGSLILTPFEQ